MFIGNTIIGLAKLARLIRLINVSQTHMHDQSLTFLLLKMNQPQAPKKQARIKNGTLINPMQNFVQWYMHTAKTANNNNILRFTEKIANEKLFHNDNLITK